MPYCGLRGENVDLPARELDDAGGLGKKSVVLAQPHIDTRLECTAALSYDDAARRDLLAAIYFNDKTLSRRVPSVPAGPFASAAF
jgi:hypothetical protein